MAWIRKLWSQPQPRPVNNSPAIAVAATGSASSEISATTRVNNSDNVSNIVANGVQQASLSSRASSSGVEKRSSRPISSCPDVVDVRLKADDSCSYVIGGGDSCDDEADSSIIESPSSPSVSALASKSLSLSHMSLSSVDDDIDGDSDRHRRSNNRFGRRKTSLVSSSSLPGHVSDWPIVADNDPSRLSTVSKETPSSSMNSLSHAVQTPDGVAEQSAAAASKSTFKKNPKKSRKRRVTSEVRSGDFSHVAVDIELTEPSSPLSEEGVKVRPSLRYAGSMKVRSEYGKEEAKTNSFKIKDRTVKFSSLSLPVSSGNMLDIYGKTGELEESIEFELQYVQHRMTGRVRSVDHLDTLVDRFSDPGLGSGLHSLMKDIAVIRPVVANSRRSQDMLNGLYADDDISITRIERQYLCNYRGSVRLLHLKDRLSHSRYMFLFNNHLLITKQRYSSNTFTLKNKIRLIDIWLSDPANNDVTSDFTDAQDKSFVIGWPMVNYLATFRTWDEKRTWFERLQQICNDRRAEQPTKDVLKIVREDQRLTVTKSLSVSLDETADRILQRCMSEFHFNEADAKDYHLVVQLPRDTGRIPLNGFERPLSIVKSQQQAIFYLVPRDKDASRTVNRRSKSPRVGLFKKAQQSQTTSDSRRPKLVLPTTSGKLFGRRIEELCINGTIVKPIMNLMQQLYDRGPFTVGIFRTAPNYGQTRTLREKLDAGSDVGELHIHTAASSLKELLRALPDCLLVCSWYSRWMDIMQEQDEQSRMHLIANQTLKLPTANSLLLRHLLCILCRIVRHADENKMTSSNLATCIAPSLLWDPVIPNSGIVNATTALFSQSNAIKLVDHLIIHATDIWKDPADCIQLLQSSKMLGTQSAASSLSVQTVSSSGSLSDSEDSSPKVMIDFDVDLSRDAMEDQLSPASRDSGLAMGGSYRYSNEELATTSVTNSSDYEPDIMLTSANGENTQLKFDDRVLPSEGLQMTRLPDILEGQSINRLDSGYPNSSSSSVAGVVSRKTGTVRERIHTHRILKTSSDESSVYRGSSTEERSLSVFEDDELKQSSSDPDNSKQVADELDGKVVIFNDNEIHGKTLSENSDTSRVVDTSKLPVSSQVGSSTLLKAEQPTVAFHDRASPSGIDSLFQNLISIHEQKYGSSKSTLVEDLAKTKTSPNTAESFGAVDTRRVNETRVLPAEQTAVPKKAQLMTLHNMNHRDVQPAVAIPEIWPTMNRLPSFNRQHSYEDDVEWTRNMRKADMRTATSSTVASKANAVAAADPSTQFPTAAPASSAHRSVVISLQPGRDQIHQVNQLQKNRQEHDYGEMLSSVDRRQPAKNVHDQSGWSSDAISVHSMKPTKQRSFDDCSSDSSVSSLSLSFEPNKPFSVSISPKQNGTVVPGGNRPMVVVGKHTDSFNSRSGAVRLQESSRLKANVVSDISTRSATSGNIGLPLVGAHQRHPQSTVVTVTDQCAIIERRQNTSSTPRVDRAYANTRQEQSRQSQPDLRRIESNDVSTMNHALWQQQQQQMQMHHGLGAANGVVHSGRPMTVSAELINRPFSGGVRQHIEGDHSQNANNHRMTTTSGHGDESTTAGVAKLRSVYVVGHR